MIDKEDFRLTRGFGVSDSKTATLIASTSLACGVVLICSLRTGIFLNMLAAMTTVPWGLISPIWKYPPEYSLYNSATRLFSLNGVV